MKQRHVSHFKFIGNTPYQVGYQHGQLAKNLIHAWFSSEEMQYLFEWCFNKGVSVFRQLKRINQKEFPDLVTEMRGLADGSDMDLDRIWVANLINELNTLRGESTSTHCSDIYAISKKGMNYGFGLGHNEDWSDEVKPWWYIATCTKYIQGMPFTYSSFVYPGTLMGWASTWNQYGLFMTQNEMLPIMANPNGLGNVFIQNRAICHSKTIHQFITNLNCGNWSTGGSVNIVDVKLKKMSNVEFWLDKMSVYPITQPPGYYYHFNKYKRLKQPNGNPIYDETIFKNDLRQQRIDTLPPPSTLKGISNLLSNPIIYNEGKDLTPPSSSKHDPSSLAPTIATVLLDGHTGTIQIWADVQPTNESPILTFNIHKLS